MYKKKIIVVVAIAVGFLSWRVGAMENKTRGLAEVVQPGSIGPVGQREQNIGLGQITRPSVVVPRKEALRAHYVSLETKDGQITEVDINTARLFESLRVRIDARLKSSLSDVSRESSKLYFLGEIEIPSSGPAKVEDTMTISTTKPVLDAMIQRAQYILERDYPGMSAAQVANLPIQERRAKSIEYTTPQPPLGRAVALLSRVMPRRVHELLDHFNAAYDLEMPELISYYGLAVAMLIGSNDSRKLISENIHSHLDLVLNQSPEIKEIINRYLDDELKAMVNFERIPMDTRIPIDSIEKKIWMLCFIGNKLKATPWAMNIWRNLDEQSQQKLSRTSMGARFEQNMREVVNSNIKPVRSSLRYPQPSQSSSGGDNQ
jgi:hypothetical protein